MASSRMVMKMLSTTRLTVKLSHGFRYFNSAPKYNCINFSEEYRNMISNKDTPLLVNYGNEYFQMISSALFYQRESTTNITHPRPVCEDAHANSWPISVEFPKDFLVCGPCRGLFCLYTAAGEFAIWNPASRDVKDLTPSDEGDIKTQTVGFGFDSIGNDYKIVRATASRRIEIYSLKTKQWKEIPVTWEIAVYLPFLSAGSFVDGACYWSSVGQDLTRFISFDVTSEQFRVDSIELLGYSNCKIEETFNGLPAAIFYTYVCNPDDHVNIWARLPKRGSVSWVFQRNVGPLYPHGTRPICFSKKNELILLGSTYELLWFDLNTNRIHKQIKLPRQENLPIQVLKLPEILTCNPWQ